MSLTLCYSFFFNCHFPTSFVLVQFLYSQYYQIYQKWCSSPVPHTTHASFYETYLTEVKPSVFLAWPLTLQRISTLLWNNDDFCTFFDRTITVTVAQKSIKNFVGNDQIMTNYVVTISVSTNFNPFLAKVPISHHLATPENLHFSMF